MITDPPYGVEYDSTWRDDTGLTRAKQRAVGLVTHDDRADWREAWPFFPGDVVYVWHASMSGHILAAGLSDSGFALRAQIIWAKQGFVFGRGHYHWQHETCWYAVRKGGSGHWSGDRKQTTLWQIDNANLMKGGARDDIVSGHSTQKPVECMRRPIENNSSPGQAVYEPFSGSGTTIIAAEQTGRSCHAIEIAPAYVDEGESGILAISPPWDRPHYEPSKRRLTWPNGAIATTYSADEP
jgi:DNA modification methylase